MNVTCDSPLQAAKEELPIPALWQLLNLPGKPARSCRSPFREDRNPSFSIYDGGRKWKDYATGEGGDAVDFVAVAFGISNEDACRKLIELAGVIHQIPHFPRVEKHTANAEEEEKARKRQQWPVFETPTPEEISAIADLRGLSIEGVSLAAERGLLYCADFREGRAYIITDSRRRNAQARRMDGKPWERIGAKAWTLPGSEAAWPIGLREASSLSAIALVEGRPDLLSAFHLAVACGVEDRIAPVAMLGANHFVPAKALALFAKKRVRIFLHADEPGMCAARHWARQLRQVAGKVDGFGFDSGDLNDFARTHPRGEEIFSSFVAVNVAEPTFDMEEARRIAGELMKMHRAGAIRATDDPEAKFLANLIHKFGATFGGVRSAKPPQLAA